MKGSLLFTTLELIILRSSKEYFDFIPKSSRWILFKKSNKKGKKYYLMIPITHGHMLVLKKVYRLVSEDLKDQIVEWVCKYDNVIHSTITDDTILVVDELIGKKTKRVVKLLLSCSVKEVHNFDYRCK